MKHPMPPNMSPEHIHSLLEILLAQKQLGFLNVFEWGSGGSTTFFPRVLKDGFLWVSAEHQPEWAEDVSRETTGLPVLVKLFDYGNIGRDRKRDPPLWDYINFPKLLDIKFDVFIVDGIQRPECIEVAKELAMMDTVIILHDAQHACYHGACDGLRIEKLILPRITGYEEDMWVMTK